MKKFRGAGFYIVLLLIIGGLFLIFNTPSSSADLSYDQMIKMYNKGEIESIKYDGSYAKVTLKAPFEGKQQYSIFITDSMSFMNFVTEKLNDPNVTINPKFDTDKPTDTGMLTSLITILIFGVIIIFIFNFMFNGREGGANSKAMSFGKSKHKISTEKDQKVRFSDVAGAEEEKEELKEIVDFLRSPAKFLELGARIPKGVILVGPPGTGKTLLAKAVSGEAGVPFYSISGSDFVEMFVGVGASRVRDLFDQAKKTAPSIVFIDEIDAVGRQRGAGMGGGHDEREQTLNQLLVEMDGFGFNEGIIVMAATNRVDILDPAILRPGRFDRRVYVGYPDVKGREEILQVHSKNKKLDHDVDLKDIAKLTPGFTGADLENLMNEAALLAAKKRKMSINFQDIKESTYKVQMGPEKKSHVVTEKDRKVTAYHEAGHAIAVRALSSTDKVDRVTIIPAGQAGGYTAYKPMDDVQYRTKRQLIENIMVALGGKAAEEIVFGEVTTGAYSDLKSANKTARNMVTHYGMSEKLGCLVFGDDSDQVFIGRDLAHTRNYSDQLAAEIDSEIRAIMDQAFYDVKNTLVDKNEALERIAKTLLEKEKIDADEFEALYQNIPYEEKASSGNNDTKEGTVLESETEIIE